MARAFRSFACPTSSSRAAIFSLGRVRASPCARAASEWALARAFWWRGGGGAGSCRKQADQERRQEVHGAILPGCRARSGNLATPQTWGGLESMRLLPLAADCTIL